MAKHELLNNVAHKNIKINTQKSAAFGDNTPMVRIFPTEFADLQREYPILIQKNRDTHEFSFVALTGFEADENLFLDDKGWHAGYVPAMIERGPFFIGMQEQEIEGVLKKEPVVHIDRDDPRVNETEGELVFLEFGGNSPYLEKIATLLEKINIGLSESKLVYDALNDLGLIELAAFDIKISDSEEYRLENFYTVNQDKLAALDDAAVLTLFRNGALQGAYSMIASLMNMKHLISVKKKRMASQTL